MCACIVAQVSVCVTKRGDRLRKSTIICFDTFENRNWNWNWMQHLKRHNSIAGCADSHNNDIASPPQLMQSSNNDNNENNSNNNRILNYRIGFNIYTSIQQWEEAEDYSISIAHTHQKFLCKMRNSVVSAERLMLGNEPMIVHSFGWCLECKHFAFVCLCLCCGVE